jgi:hypothetical protein
MKKDLRRAMPKNEASNLKPSQNRPTHKNHACVFCLNNGFEQRLTLRLIEQSAELINI